MLEQKSTKLIVMDDETYCTVDPESINGVKFYSCANKKMYKTSTNSNLKKNSPRSI